MRLVKGRKYSRLLDRQLSVSFLPFQIYQNLELRRGIECFVSTVSDLPEPGLRRGGQRLRRLQRVCVRLRPDRQRQNVHHDGNTGTDNAVLEHCHIDALGQGNTVGLLPCFQPAEYAEYSAGICLRGVAAMARII